MQAGNTFLFNGDLDDIRLYRRALPTRVIQALAVGQDDTDADGCSDAKEYEAGTDPNVSSSVFRVTAVTGVPPAIAVCFLSSTNRLYSLQLQGRLGSNVWNGVPGQTNTPGTGSLLWLNDNTTNPAGFYRVHLTQ